MSINTLVKYLNKPLPKCICQSAGKGDHCKLDWVWIIGIGTLFTIVFIGS